MASPNLSMDQRWSPLESNPTRPTSVQPYENRSYSPSSMDEEFPTRRGQQMTLAEALMSSEPPPPPRAAPAKSSTTNSFIPSMRKNFASTTGRFSRSFAETSNTERNSGSERFGRSFAEKASKAGLTNLKFTTRAWRGVSGRASPSPASAPPVQARSHSAMEMRDDPASSMSAGTYFYHIESQRADEPDPTRLYVNRGKVSPIDPEEVQRPLSRVSSISTLSDIHLTPAVPRKSSRRTVGSDKSSGRVSIPKKYSAQSSVWRKASGRSNSADAADVLSFSRFDQKTRTKQGPEDPADLAMDHNSSGNHSQQNYLGSRFSWTTANTDPRFSITGPDLNPEEAAIALEQPRSRFSWTTTATDSTMPQSPTRQDSGERQQFLKPTSPPVQSIMSRRRPYTGPDAEQPASPQQIKRKPVGSDVSPPQGPRKSLEGTQKELPLSPPAKDSYDIITALEAELAELATRRINITRVKKSLTDLQPQNPVVQDLTKRRMLQRRVEELDKQLDDVKNKEHEVGLRLHRAWRKRTQNNDSALWVRRVTS